MADNQDPKLPQWMRSRLAAVAKKPKCGPTHGACRCFLEKIINTEGELSKLRKELHQLRQFATWVRKDFDPRMDVYATDLRREAAEALGVELDDDELDE